MLQSFPMTVHKTDPGASLDLHFCIASLASRLACFCSAGIERHYAFLTHPH
ncbi:hypothetical protein BN439_0930 [Erwinia amylovora Ea644]|nr:hypothetical protein BN439_0930 [Erwinia amylovora Ea644]